MMRKWECGILVVFLVLLGMGLGVEAKDLQGKFGLRLLGGISSPDARDYNQYWEEAKEWLEYWGGWDEIEIDKLKTTSLFGAELRYGISSKILAGLGYLSESGKAKLTATASMEVEESRTVTGGYVGTMEEDINVTGIILSLYYIFYEQPQLNLYGGVGLGSYSSKIKHRGDAGGHPDWEFYDWDGKGKDTSGFLARAGGEYFISDKLSLGLEIMYRSLQISEITITKHSEDPYWEGKPLTHLDSDEKVKLDLTGIVFLLGLCMYL